MAAKTDRTVKRLKFTWGASDGTPAMSSSTPTEVMEIGGNAGGSTRGSRWGRCPNGDEGEGFGRPGEARARNSLKRGGGRQIVLEGGYIANPG